MLACATHSGNRIWSLPHLSCATAATCCYGLLSAIRTFVGFLILGKKAIPCGKTTDLSSTTHFSNFQPPAEICQRAPSLPLSQKIHHKLSRMLIFFLAQFFNLKRFEPWVPAMLWPSSWVVSGINEFAASMLHAVLPPSLHAKKRLREPGETFWPHFSCDGAELSRRQSKQNSW